MTPVLVLLAATSTASEAPDPLRYAKYAAIVDGGWSLALTASWALSARSHHPPYPDGLVALAAARVLYGTTWSVLLTAEIAAARALAGEDWHGVSHGTFKNHWLVGFDVPGRCSARAPGGGGCGLGLGSFGEISARITRGDFPLRAALTGGWIQGRYDDDPRRTLVESTWVQSPLGLWVEPRLAVGPVALQLSLGPGVYWGMHNAHLHPKRGSDLQVPIHEIIPLHTGIGPGGHAALSLSFFDTVALEANADLAIFLLAGTNRDAAPKIAPLEAFEGHGLPTWRRAGAGVSLSVEAFYPLKVAAKIFGCELSSRRIDRLGHTAVGLEFEVPLELDEE